MSDIRIKTHTITGGKQYWYYKADDAIGQSMAYLRDEEILPMKAAIELAVSIVFHPSAIQRLGGSPEQIEASILRSKKALAYYLDQRASVPLDDQPVDARSQMDGMDDLDLQLSRVAEDWAESNDDQQMMPVNGHGPSMEPAKDVFSKEDAF